MVKLRREQAFQDERGVIVDLLIDENINAITYLTLALGAVRGNHFHNETRQWTFVISGRVTYAESSSGGAIDAVVGLPGDLFLSEPRMIHAVRADIESSIIVFTSGPRAGESYEKDTYRVDNPIL